MLSVSVSVSRLVSNLFYIDITATPNEFGIGLAPSMAQALLRAWHRQRDLGVGVVANPLNETDTSIANDTV
jgi:hypothetical protein